MVANKIEYMKPDDKNATKINTAATFVFIYRAAQSYQVGVSRGNRTLDNKNAPNKTNAPSKTKVYSTFMVRYQKEAYQVLSMYALFLI